MTNIEKQPAYVAWIKYHYSALVGLFSDIIVFTVDHAGEIAIRALPVVAPLPNAIGMYKTSMDALHFSSWQALLFAAAIEISIFALAEIAVVMWDSWQGGDTLYSKPFKLMAWVTGFVALLIIVLVFTLEVYGASGHWILATLPLISVASAVGLCMKRFHKRRSEAKVAKAQDTITALNYDIQLLTVEVENLRMDVLSERKQHNDAVQLLADVRTEHAAHVTTLTATIDALRNVQQMPVTRQETPILDAGNADNFPSKMLDAKRKKAEARQDQLLSILLNEFAGADIGALNKTELGNRLGTTRQTINTDLEALSSAGKITLNGHVTIH